MLIIGECSHSSLLHVWTDSILTLYCSICVKCPHIRLLTRIHQQPWDNILTREHCYVHRAWQHKQFHYKQDNLSNTMQCYIGSQKKGTNAKVYLYYKWWLAFTACLLQQKYTVTTQCTVCSWHPNICRHLLTIFSSRFTCPEDGGDTFLRNVGSNQNTRRKIPEDGFLQ
jgi:hypothetical protein